MKAIASEPTRSTGSAVIGFGLINIPVSLYTSVETTRVARKEFSKDGNPVGRQQFDKITEEVIGRGETIKMAEASDGTFVELTDDEVAAVTGNDDGTAPIIALISIDTLHAEYSVEKMMQIRPRAEKKGGKAYERSFALLMAALQARNEAAIVKIAMRRSVAKYAAITPDGYFSILHYEDAVRKARPMPSVELSDDELSLATQLLDSIGSEVPTMIDETAAAIQAYVDDKAASGETAVAAPVATATATDDLSAMLAASLKASA